MKNIKSNRDSRYIVECVFKTDRIDLRKIKLEELLIKVIRTSENKNS